jgi:hypothetical protein
MLKTANWFDIISLLFNYSQRYRVEGDSMLPTLKQANRLKSVILLWQIILSNKALSSSNESARLVKKA